MFKITAIFGLLFLGSLAFPKNRNDEWDEEDLHGFLHVVFCACDEDFSGGLSHEEMTSGVCLAIVQYEAPKEDFDAADTDGDGEISMDEAIAWANEYAPETRMAYNRENFFSDDDHVEAIVRVMGCVCDSDGSWTLDMQELSSPDCQDAQMFIFGGTADQNIFDHIDSNQDGEIEGKELAAAIEEHYSGTDY